MAELNLTLRYKSKPARIAFIVMLATLPIWEVGAPVAIGYVIGEVLFSPATFSLSTLVTVIPSMIALIVFGIAGTAVAEDNRIYISKDGISFPPFLLPKLKYKRARDWQELTRAELISGGDDGDNKRLFLYFQDSSILALNLNCFDKNDVEQLLLGIELWGKNCQRSPELVSYQNQIQNQAQGISYTQMWEEELNRRFQSTTFVPLEPEQKLQNGKLKIVRQLAFGGLSAIYLAQEEQRDLVVVKEAVVPESSDVLARAEAEKHLIREAEMLARFKHPSAARVLDHFIEGGRHYLKLEYINGTDLRQYIKQNGPISEEQAIQWGLQILEVLSALHSQSPPIIHRDLTPENLVLAKEQIMLIDFGAANEFVGTATGTIVGKQAYMPAEQVRGKSTTQSDIYAFAGTMHYLLTGKDPLPLAIAIPKQHNSKISDELNQVISQCSQFEPEERPASAEDVIKLFKALQPNRIPIQEPIKS